MDLPDPAELRQKWRETKPETRLDGRGQFDEFVCGGENLDGVHFEMMDKATLWCGVDHPDGSRHVLWIRAEGGKLDVRCERDA